MKVLGRVGSYDHGRVLCDQLERVGCDVLNLGKVDGPSGVAIIYVSDAGENCIVVAPGANAHYLASDVETETGQFDGGRVLLIQFETPVDTVVAAARFARLRGLVVILDPAPALRVLPQAL